MRPNDRRIPAANCEALPIQFYRSRQRSRRRRNRFPAFDRLDFDPVKILEVLMICARPRLLLHWSGRLSDCVSYQPIHGVSSLGLHPVRMIAVPGVPLVHHDRSRRDDSSGRPRPIFTVGNDGPRRGTDADPGARRRGIPRVSGHAAILVSERIGLVAAGPGRDRRRIVDAPTGRTRGPCAQELEAHPAGKALPSTGAVHAGKLQVVRRG